VDVPDRFGRAVHPREWFLVPLQVIDEVVKRILDRTITEYACLRSEEGISQQGSFTKKLTILPRGRRTPISQADLRPCDSRGSAGEFRSERGYSFARAPARISIQLTCGETGLSVRAETSRRRAQPARNNLAIGRPGSCCWPLRSASEMAQTLLDAEPTTCSGLVGHNTQCCPLLGLAIVGGDPSFRTPPMQLGCLRAILLFRWQLPQTLSP